MITFNLELWQLLQLLAATVLPLVAGFITHRLADSAVKAVVLLALAAGTSLLTELAAALQTGAAYDLGAAALFAITSFLIGVGMHFGFYKPTGTADAVAAVGLSLGKP